MNRIDDVHLSQAAADLQQVNRTGQLEQAVPVGRGSKASRGVERQDQVEVSGTTARVIAALKVLQKMRLEQVQQIREQLQAGSYQVDHSRLAKALVADALNGTQAER